MGEDIDHHGHTGGGGHGLQQARGWTPSKAEYFSKQSALLCRSLVRSDRETARLESVDTSLLSQLTGGHSKSALEFNHLETGTLKLRHILSYRRLMFHHEILTRDENETLRKVYNKQKEEPLKLDWYTLLEKDFTFLGTSMDEEKISRTPKEVYKMEMETK